MQPSLHPCSHLHGPCSQRAWALKIQDFQKGVWLRRILGSCSSTSLITAQAGEVQSKLA